MIAPAVRVTFAASGGRAVVRARMRDGRPDMRGTLADVAFHTLGVRDGVTELEDRGDGSFVLWAVVGGHRGRVIMTAAWDEEE